MDTKNNLDEPTAFSLVLGGPLFQLYRRTRLSGPALELAVRRLIVITAIAWLPLLLLAAWQGHLWQGVQVPFFVALETHVRLLVVLPLLLAAEVYAHDWSRTITSHFLDRDLIAPEDRPRFDAIVASALRVRNSALLELLLLVLAFIWHWVAIAMTFGVSTWYGVWKENHLQFSPAGYWAALVSLPLLRFILLRWYARLCLWYWFAWQLARLPLRLNALHPDRASGLGFLARSLFALSPVLLAHSAFIAGTIGNRIWHAGAHLPAFKIEISALLIFLLLVVLAPLTFFSNQMLQARRNALREYGSTASRYVRDFREKWIKGQAPEGEQMLGSSDIQSLADLGNSFAVANEARIVPFSRENVVMLALMLAAPLLPLLLFEIPLEEILDRIVGILL